MKSAYKAASDRMISTTTHIKGGIMIAPETKPTIQLTGHDGNAFAIMGTARKALKKAGADQEYIDKYTADAQSGDYDNLLQVTMDYCDCE
jgi:hypothetical protein